MAKRIVFCLSLLLALGVCAQEWYRGNLHMHTYWSDGKAFPEEAAEYYRSRGYHFICLSDHNVMQLSDKHWQEVGGKKVTAEAAEKYLHAYGDTAEKKTEDGKEHVRVKTLGEMKKQFDKAGEFLIVPCFEQTGKCGEFQVHMNVFNVKGIYPYQKGETIAETVGANARVAAEQGKDTLFMLNHPFWPYFDIQPEVLISLPEVRFYELSNGGNSYPAAHPGWYSLEKYWDIVNAFRIKAGHPALYGTATDDTHDYSKPERVTTLKGWVSVRAPSLACDALVQAMHRGDFYASTGITFRDVRFDEATGTLSVEAEPKPGVDYEITFTVTRAGFDTATEVFDDPATDKKPARKGLKYSGDIGITAKKVSGTSASYKMQPDDLYVRATVTSPAKMAKPALCGPFVETAWTQPYGWQQWQTRQKRN